MTSKALILLVPQQRDSLEGSFASHLALFNEKTPEVPNCPHPCLLITPESCIEKCSGKRQYPQGLCHAHLFPSNYDICGEPPTQSLHSCEWQYFSKGLVKIAGVVVSSSPALEEKLKLPDIIFKSWTPQCRTKILMGGLPEVWSD